MKQFLVFIADHYYPKGGMEDFCNDFDNLDEAMELIKKQMDKSEDVLMPIRAHIYDTHIKKIIWRNQE